MDMIHQTSARIMSCYNQPRRLVTYLWLTTMIVGILYAIAAIIAAVHNNGKHLSDSKALGFTGIWATLLIIGLSVGGTMVMRKFQTPLAVGFFIGVVIMMSLQMFSIGILFAGEASLAREERKALNITTTHIHSNEAASVFSFFMFLLYGAFGAVLIKHRDIVIKDAKSTASPNSNKLPPVVSSSPSQFRADNEKSAVMPVSV